ncbi:MAG: hypothetical protein A3E01_03045 [Gammaproteobacteria bacterium RIFCSPHIGHO2_12_FULL_63_22]|nr:MAG: hypothetical protein A3E01_03045 [Gammaproteobacteria bacterium RIFCSPHIGHO2_12_FULL_63_22]
MTYDSSHNGMPVISDDNADQFLNPVVDGVMRMCSAMPQPEGAPGFAAVKPLKTFSRADLIARIKQQQATKSDLISILDSRSVPVKDQGRTNYCWIYGTVHSMEIAYSLQGEDFVPLSATAAGVMITGGQNRGGYIGEAVQYLGEHGTCPQSMWPEHNLSLRNNSDAVESAATANLLTEWNELPYGDLDQLDAALALNYPIAAELPWWRHVIVFVGHTLLPNGELGRVIDNSWGSRWGKNGRGVLTPEKARGRMYIPVSVKPR